MRFFFPGHPTAEQIGKVRDALMAGEILTAHELNQRGISARMMAHVLRYKLNIPVKTMEIVVESTVAEELAEEFEADYTEFDASEAAEMAGGKVYGYYVPEAEIKRYFSDPEGQARDYREIIRLNRVRREAATTARGLRSRGEIVPESVLRDAFMKIPAVTDGTSQIGQVVYVNFKQPEAANDAVFKQEDTEKKGSQ